MPPAGFEPAIAASELPLNLALDNVATVTGSIFYYLLYLVASVRAEPLTYANCLSSLVMYEQLKGKAPVSN
jgi:hypothetical protein